MRRLLVIGCVLLAIALGCLWNVGSQERRPLEPAEGVPSQGSSGAELELSDRSERGAATQPASLDLAAQDAAPPAAAAAEADSPPGGGSFLEIQVLRDDVQVPGVTVWIGDRRGWQPLDFLDVAGELPSDVRSLETDPRGLADFRDLPLSRFTVGLDTRRPGRSPRVFVLRERHHGQRYTVALGSASIRGRVFDADGQPWVGVGVQASNLHSDAHFTFLATQAVTDDDGGYEIGDLAHGQYSVVMEPDGKFDGFGAPQSRRIKLAQGELGVLDFGSFLGLPKWRGRVLNASLEAFLGTGLLSLREVDGDGRASVKIEVGGHFEFPFSPGTWHVMARVTGAPDMGFDLGEVELQAEDTHRDLVVPGLRVTGTLTPPDVVDERSTRPHSWTQISFRPVGADYSAAIRIVNVDSEGRYLIDGLEAGDWTVGIWPGRLEGDQPVEFTLHEGQGTLELQLRRPPH